MNRKIFDTDLMVGNIVRLKSHPEYPLHVSAISPDTISFRESFGDGKIWDRPSCASISDVEGIPIDSAVISENFTKTETEMYAGIGPFVLMFEEGGFYLHDSLSGPDPAGYHRKFRPRYIHELQNLLHAFDVHLDRGIVAPGYKEKYIKRKK